MCASVKNPVVQDYRRIDNCRICGGHRLRVIWDGGEMCVVDFPLLGHRSHKPKVPLRLVVCESCWLVQLMHTTNPDLLYSEFWYRSGINEMMKKQLNDVVKAALHYGQPEAGDWILDIGCNDGTMLSMYQRHSKRKLNLVGVDPAIVGGEFREIQYVQRYFSAGAALNASAGKRYKVVTAIAMFYDLDDPIAFAKAVKEVLHDDGIFIVQMNYLPAMLKSNGVDNISHEHLTYFSLTTLTEVFRQAGLNIFRGETNDTNGGSLRVYAEHEQRGKSSWLGDEKVSVSRYDDGTANALRSQEQYLCTLYPYEQFSERVINTCRVMNEFLDTFRKMNKVVYAYGASTRGTTLLQLLQTDSIIACADRDPRKWGRYMVGSNLRIVSEEEARPEADVFLVLPWHFMNSIWFREENWIDKGGQFLVPLPHPRIMKWIGEDVRP